MIEMSLCCQCAGSAAPSLNPKPHRHFTLEPCKHRLADLKIAKDSLVLTKLTVSE